MSEKQAKAERKAAAEGNIKYVISITVMKDGGFEMEVPKGSSIPLTLDVLMRASQRVLATFVQALQQKKAASAIIQPAGRIPDGLLRRAP